MDLQVPLRRTRTTADRPAIHRLPLRQRIRAAMIARRLARSRFGRRHDRARRELLAQLGTAFTVLAGLVLAVLLITG